MPKKKLCAASAALLLCDKPLNLLLISPFILKQHIHISQLAAALPSLVELSPSRVEERLVEPSCRRRRRRRSRLSCCRSSSRCYWVDTLREKSCEILWLLWWRWWCTSRNSNSSSSSSNNSSSPVFESLKYGQGEEGRQARRQGRRLVSVLHLICIGVYFFSERQTTMMCMRCPTSRSLSFFRSLRPDCIAIDTRCRTAGKALKAQASMGFVC